jgi:hypothetical protein
MVREGPEKSGDVVEREKPVAPDPELSTAPIPAPTPSSPTVTDGGTPALESEPELESRADERRRATAPLDEPEAVFEEEPTRFRDLDVGRSERPLELQEHGARLWIDRRLLDLSERLEQRLFLDPELRRFGDLSPLPYSQREELQQQELSARLFDELRSSCTKMARDEMKPLRTEARETLLEEPLVRLFSLDSSDRHPAEEDGPDADPAIEDGEASLTLVRSSRSGVERLLRSFADWTSRALPGELDFRTSVTARRARIGASYRPWTDPDDPQLLRGISFRASRDYEDYLGHSKVVDHLDCRLDLFASRRSRGRLILEREREEGETVTRFGLSWVCQF